jgi:outer membrane translocation and assembly module TamA
VFLDAGNVFAHPRAIRFAEIRPTPGFGIRWKSPLGPFRADIGFNPDRRVVRGRLENGFEYHITLGQAF